MRELKEFLYTEINKEILCYYQEADRNTNLIYCVYDVNTVNRYSDYREDVILTINFYGKKHKDEIVLDEAAESVKKMLHLSSSLVESGIVDVINTGQIDLSSIEEQIARLEVKFLVKWYNKKMLEEV